MTKKTFPKIICILLVFLSFFTLNTSAVLSNAKTDLSEFSDFNAFIKWVDFNVPAEILKKVYALDVKYHGSEIDFKFTDALAYLAIKNGNNFSSKSDAQNLNKLIARLEKKEISSINNAYKDTKYFAYYSQAYQAVFSEFIGEYIQDGKEGYGLKAYSPIAKGYWYSHYDDFGNKRSFGFNRRHLGHDMFGSTGSPIIAVEGGTVTELGWNRYGGWRVGIRSFDQKRYYYYAHLRKDRPFPADLKAGDTVEAGQVIGYLGSTGYSSHTNVNMKSKPHLHFGLQLIFDESQADGNGEIWIDLYAITDFLAMNKAAVVKDPATKEYKSTGLRRGR